MEKYIKNLAEYMKNTHRSAIESKRSINTQIDFQLNSANDEISRSVSTLRWANDILMAIVREREIEKCTYYDIFKKYSHSDHIHHDFHYVIKATIATMTIVE